MTVFLANCTVSILRGTVTDAYGDPKDRDDPVHTGIPASIITVRTSETTFASGRPQQVSYLVGRLPPGTDIQAQDRLYDEQNGTTYIVDGVDLDARSPILDAGVRLDLRRVS